MKKNTNNIRKRKSRMNFKQVKIVFLASLLSISTVSAKDKPCEINGIKLYGKVQFVDSFPDIKIEYVSSFSDIDVKFVNSFADSCGEWEEVTSFPDFKVQIVTSFADLKVRKVSAFSGMR
jgi:hypothetical protein